MQIEVISASNLSPKYLLCVPYFIDFWLSLATPLNVAVRPVVYLVADEMPPELLALSEYITLVNSELPSAFVSQTIRCLKAGLSTADLTITSDIDMLPLSFKVFEKAIEKMTSDSDFVVCRDVLETGEFPICYSLANPAVWREVYGVFDDRSVQEKLEEIFKGTLRRGGYDSKHGGEGWFSDQLDLFTRVRQFEASGGQVIRLKDDETGHNRLDRVAHIGPLVWLALPMVILRRFTDYHVHHPVNRHKVLLFFVKRAMLLSARVSSRGWPCS
jgi:hypothetical protein